MCAQNRALLLRPQWLFRNHPNDTQKKPMDQHQYRQRIHHHSEPTDNAPAGPWERLKRRMRYVILMGLPDDPSVEPER